MRALPIAIGQRFGRLTVIEIVSRLKGKSKSRIVVSKCDCGNLNESEPWALVRGKTQSCGCYWRAQHTRHGLSRSKVYETFWNMHSRCRYPGTNGYQRYGGRGIKVCARWQDFSCFLADMGMPPDGRSTLDRIDPDGDYEPGNVRWASKLDQRRARRRNRQVRDDSRHRYMGIVKSGKLRFGAKIKILGRSRWLGSYATEEEAARAYDDIARVYGFPLNFPHEETA